jgi:hypothetical protein
MNAASGCCLYLCVTVFHQILVLVVNGFTLVLTVAITVLPRTSMAGFHAARRHQAGLMITIRRRPVRSRGIKSIRIRPWQLPGFDYDSLRRRSSLPSAHAKIRLVRSSPATHHRSLVVGRRLIDRSIQSCSAPPVRLP